MEVKRYRANYAVKVWDSMYSLSGQNTWYFLDEATARAQLKELIFQFLSYPHWKTSQLIDIGRRGCDRAQRITILKPTHDFKIRTIENVLFLRKSIVVPMPDFSKGLEKELCDYHKYVQW